MSGLLLGREVEWIDFRSTLRPEADIERLTAPYIGGDDPIFGFRCDLALNDFFDASALRALREKLQDASENVLTIVYGTGSGLLYSPETPDWRVGYVDLPKNELQFRQRAGSVSNLGFRSPVQDAKRAYKRSYFVDWPVERRHQAQLLPFINLFIDGQRPDDLVGLAGDDLRQALLALSMTPFRARPWFEPGPWGGQWIKAQVPQLPQDVPNYAWSFELISPENGLLLTSDGLLLELSFDFLMFQASGAVLGEAAPRFGTEFPIRFDWLDTVRGGNLSLQCHPAPEYIRRHFGETFTQDETYYMLDCEPEATVYLGFQQGIDPSAFRSALERSAQDATPVEVEEFVQRFPARKHDLFLIPHGTVHCSGVGGMVLEISATPYIFTFKLYDWLRLGLDGRPRPLNIDRAFENLNFERAGESVQRELLSRPRELGRGRTVDGAWRLEELPTHPDHFYAIERLTFSGEFEWNTGDRAQVAALVEGRRLQVVCGERRLDVRYAETFVVPAAAGQVTLHTAPGEEVTLVMSYVRPGQGEAIAVPRGQHGPA